MRASRIGLGATALAALLALTACGGDGGTSTTVEPGDGDSAMRAYQDCLKKQGVDVPQRKGGPSGAPPGGRPGGQPGGPGPMPSMNAERQKAFQACASLRPTPNGRGGPDGPNVQAMTAFRDCMTRNGAEIAANARPDDLQTGDPKVAKALEECRALLPSQSPAPAAS